MIENALFIGQIMLNLEEESRKMEEIKGKGGGKLADCAVSEGRSEVK